MNKMKLGVIIIVIMVLSLHYTSMYTDHIESADDTIIISVCTGDMRGLETGVSVYAGYNNIPLILSDEELPTQISNWLTSYVIENNIKQVIVVGELKPTQLLKLESLGLSIKQIKGDNIADILTKMADNTQNKKNDTLIFTSSEPIAGELGAYTKTPVFITALNSSYNSSETLSIEYKKYLETHEIKHIIIIGNLPNTLKNQLKTYNTTIEEINGQDNLELSKNINTKLKNEGYLNNTTTAYYGFYGELPTIVPLTLKNNAIMIEDSSNNGNIIEYLEDNNISTVYLTRNTKTQYIQMEEEDYISSDVIEELEKRNITVEILTNNRTLNEATGLYDNRIITTQNIKNHTKIIKYQNNNTNKSQSPPLISMLNKTRWIDSNNLQAHITRNNSNYIVKWDSVHPYTWNKMNDTYYEESSDNGYKYIWEKITNTEWTVNYYYQNNNYYNIKWIKNNDNTWTEIQEDNNYTWQYDGNNWYCLNDNSEIIYSLISY